MEAKAGDKTRHRGGNIDAGQGCLHHGDRRGHNSGLFSRGMGIRPLRWFIGGGQGFLARRQGRPMITLHRLMLSCILIMAFFQGALNAGRDDLLRQMLNTKLLSMSLSQLSNFVVRKS